jgi:hypothetical protein
MNERGEDRSRTQQTEELNGKATQEDEAGE